MTMTVILGGGFGGIATANTLRQLVPAAHEIVVVDQGERFHVGAGKTWVMLGERSYEEISQSRRALLHPDVRFIQAQVQALDLEQHTVRLPGDTLTWDHLVIALGADLNAGRVPGLAEAAHTFYTPEGAEQLRPVLDQFTGGDIAFLIPIAPVKCPPAPYEAAILLSEAFERRGLADKVRIALYTIEGAPMATAGPEVGRFVVAQLAERGIAYHPQKVTTHVDGAARMVYFEDGSAARYDLLIAVPPHEAPQVVRDAGLTNQSGYIPVDPQTLRVKTAPAERVLYAIGDVTVMPLPGRYKPEVGLSLPKAGVFAEAQGKVVAHQIAATILGQTATETFDGHGYCYLEVGGGQAMRADGNFFAVPHPAVTRPFSDKAQWRHKLDWVAAHLRPTH